MSLLNYEEKDKYWEERCLQYKIGINLKHLSQLSPKPMLGIEKELLEAGVKARPRSPDLNPISRYIKNKYDEVIHVHIDIYEAFKHPGEVRVTTEEFV